MAINSKCVGGDKQKPKGGEPIDKLCKMLSLGFSTPLFFPKNSLSPLEYNYKPFSYIPGGGAPTPSKSNEGYPNCVSLPKSRKELHCVACDNSNAVAGGENEEQLPAGLKPELMPKHVSLFLDGHRRWAKENNLSLEIGNLASLKPLKEMARFCCQSGVKVLSVFAFNTGNWRRPKEEVDLGMRLFEAELKSDLEDFMRMGIRFTAIGNTKMLPKSLQELLTRLEEGSKDNSKLHFIAAMNYSGRCDIMQACANICTKVKDDLIQLEDMNERLFEKELQTNCAEFPCPDLLIRTGNTRRLGNFMLWQLAYTELFFVDKLAPDFKVPDLTEVLRSFQKRQRRYGGQAN